MTHRRALNGGSIAARKRALLLLAKHRQSLRAKHGYHGHVKSRYEDLFLATLLARLERDWLTQPLASSPEPHGRVAGEDRRLRAGVAEWAHPWGVALLATLQADLYHLEESVKRLGNWLPPRPRMAAEQRARERLERISAEVEEGHAPDSAVEAAAGKRAAEKERAGAVEKERGSGGPFPTRIAAIAAALVAAAGLVGLVFVAPESDDGSTPSVNPPPGAEAPRRTVAMPSTDAHAQGPGPRGTAPDRRATGGKPAEANQPVPQVTAEEAAQSVSVSADVSAPAPAPVPEGPAPAPAPEPATPSPEPAPSEDQVGASKAGGGCPPEFGFEC